MKNFFFVILIGISLTGYTKTEINNIKNNESDKSSYGFNIGHPGSSTNIIFVDSSATGSNNGTSWADAFTSLQSALDAAISGDTIWVAKGTYYPSSGYNLCDNSGDSTRFYHFRMKENVKIFGGFAGNEDPAVFNLNDRDFITNNTILTGDIGTRGDSTDNCYHVFYHPYGINLTTSALLDGVTITGGNADGDFPHYNGGGMFNNSSSPTLTNVKINLNSAAYRGGGMVNDFYSSPILTNVTIILNTAMNFGGGIFNTYYSSPTLTNINIIENTTYYSGGGMYNDYYSSPTLTNVNIIENKAYLGGGMFNNSSSSPTLTNVTINLNTAAGNGGGMYNDYSSPTFSNVNLIENTANFGGGICNHGSSSSILNNSIIWGNSASSSGNEFYIESGDSVILNYSCYKNNSGDVYNDGGTFIDTNHNITTDPQFADVANGDYRLTKISPCLDAGYDSYNSELYDIRGIGFGRKLLKTDSSQIGPIDMGAYEYKNGVDLLNFNHKFVDSSATGANNGTSWADAFTSLQEALNAAESGDTIWVAKGTYYPSSGYNLCDNSGDSTRFYHFRMKENVKIYGGFAGNEDPAVFNLNDRDFITNKTILSGDIGTPDVITDNCYHVFYHPDGSNLSASAVLDGFTIADGNANDSYPTDRGGGMANWNCSPTLTNVTIRDNTAIYGGGIYNEESSPTLTNVTITENTAEFHGGGMYNGYCSPTLINVTFSENSAVYYGGGICNEGGALFMTDVIISDNIATYGGGMYNVSSSPTLTNVTISNNTASNNTELPWGGGMYNSNSNPTLNYVNISGSDGEGMYNYYSNPTLANVTISENTSSFYGGGMYNYYSNPTLTNVTISRNTAVYYGGGIYNCYSSPTLTNITIIENTSSYQGGGMYNYINCSPILTNVNISENSTSHDGGGIFNYSSSPTLSNVTISNNTAENMGGGIYNEGSSSTLNNSIIWGNAAQTDGNEFYIGSGSAASLNYSCYDNNSGDIVNEGTFTASNHNITADPQFADAANGDYRLMSTSPCLDTGNDSYNYELYDIRGVGFGRKLLKTDSSQTGPIDMGAYEYKNGIDGDLFICGSGYNIRDIDGNVYETVEIGLTCWTKQNMKTTHYANGDLIRFAEGYYAAEYPNAEENITKFGRLYSWYSAVVVPENSTETPTADTNHHIQGICPNGWYLPDDTTYSELMAWGGDAIRSDSLWLNGQNGTNSTGFNALPAGFYNTTSEQYCFLLGNTFFWSSNSVSNITAEYVELQCHCPELLFYKANKGNGYSIRCVRKL